MILTDTWFQAFCAYLGPLLELPVIVHHSNWTTFPHLYVEWTGKQPQFGQSTGTAIFSIATSMEEETVDEPYAQKLRILCSSILSFPVGDGVFKEIKEVRKADKKVKTLSLHYEWFITRKP